MIKTNRVKGVAWCFMLFFLLSGLNVNAQDDANDRFTLGVKIGGNISALTSDYIGLSDVKPGYQAGLFCQLRFSKLLSIETGALYANVGCNVIDPVKVFFPGTPGTQRIVKTKVVLNALQVPALLNIYVIDMGSFKSRFILGADFNYYLSAQAINTSMEAFGETESKTNASSSFQNYDIGAVAGIGLDFKDLFHLMSIEIKYRSGITPVNYITSSTYKDFGVNTLSLNLGFSF